MPHEYGRTQGFWPDGRVWKIQDYCIKMQGVQYSKSLKRWTNLKKQLPSEGIPQRSLPHTLKLVSWNLQHEERNFGERCATVVEYLQDILLDDDDDVITGRPVPFVLALQEIPKIQFGTILKIPWIKERFSVFPEGPQTWPTGATYGNITLIDRSIPIFSASMFWYPNSNMHRTALVVDIIVPRANSDPNSPKPAEGRTFRVINTHLESLPENVHRRMDQLHWLKRYIDDRDKWLSGVVLCGDMNALRPEDVNVVPDLGLKDAFDVQGKRKRELGDLGVTWVHPKGQFPSARLDKILYRENKEKYEVGILLRAGLGPLRTEQRNQPVSDHYGVTTLVRIKVKGYYRRAVD